MLVCVVNIWLLISKLDRERLLNTEEQYDEDEFETELLNYADLRKINRKATKDDEWYTFTLDINNNSRTWSSKLFDKHSKTW